MHEIHASVVQVFVEDGVLNVHFDDEGEHYLQLQVPEVDDPDELEDGYGNVYVEIDGQINGGSN